MSGPGYDGVVLHNGRWRMADGRWVKVVHGTNGFYAKRPSSTSTWKGRGGRRGSSTRWEYEAGLIGKLRAEIEAGVARPAAETAEFMRILERDAHRAAHPTGLEIAAANGWAPDDPDAPLTGDDLGYALTDGWVE